jgi:predicted DNA-binding transcriptional regulator AlpA
MNTPEKSAPRLGGGGGTEDQHHGSDPLLLSEPEAARMLSISARKLWSLRKSGAVPAMKIGGAVRYPRDGLAEWVRRGCPEHAHAGEEIRLELLRRAAGVRA